MLELTAAEASKRRQTLADRGERCGLVIAWIAVFTLLEPGVFLTWTNFSILRPWPRLPRSQ